MMGSNASLLGFDSMKKRKKKEKKRKKKEKRIPKYLI
jgi:hypothetical protein